MKRVPADGIVLEVYDPGADTVNEMEFGVRDTSKYLALLTPYTGDVRAVLSGASADRLLAGEVVECELDEEPVLIALKVLVHWHSEYTKDALPAGEEWREQA